jgi:hypothetical protein
MSLVSFHRFLITAAILFCLGFAGWEARAYASGGGTQPLIWAIVFLLLGAGLVVYLARLASILKLDDPSDRPG